MPAERPGDEDAVVIADDDGDGDADDTDQFPTDASEWDDTDGDGIGNNEDTDDDADGVLDAADAFPLDSTETVDTDGDGTGNNADTDDDGDGYSDADETTNCGEGNDPLDAASTPTDTDGDLSCNALDADDDGDGVDDTSDAFPLDAAETVDYDGDGVGDNADTDDDADGYADDVDAFDNDLDAWTDTDGDGLADDFPGLSVYDAPWTESSSLTAIVYGSTGTPVSFTLNNGQRAVITVNLDSYPSECGMIVDGVSVGCSDTTITTAGSHTVQMLDSWGDGGSSATISIQDGTATTPATSPAGTVLDNDDDGDTVSDADEAAAGTDPLDTDTDADGTDDANDVFPLDATESADADADMDAPETPDVKESIDPAGPALLIGFGLLPGHESFVNDVISIPLRFSIGADNIFKGFGLMALYERASVLDGKVFIDNDDLARDAYSRLTFGPTFRINKFRIVAGIDLFGPMGFFRSSGAESGVAGSGRKFLGVSYDVFKGFYVGIDASSYASVGIMINYSIPLGNLDSE